MLRPTIYIPSALLGQLAGSQDPKEGRPEERRPVILPFRRPGHRPTPPPADRPAASAVT
ncbi:MAG: hypothetical protein AB7S39_06090 [Gemmatimonadales bacterium]